MRVEVLESAKCALKNEFNGKNVVVIDVLRATTVMVTALENGASCIYPFKEIDEAKEKWGVKKDGFLAGERKGLKIEGFKFGNSPLEFTKEAVQGKEIFMTTSNGTRAIENALSADNLYIACYLNISAVSEKLLESRKDVVILCAGTDDEFSLDDSLCAGMIIKKISEKESLKMDDLGLALKKIADLTSDIKGVLAESKHYSYLKSIGCEKDLDYCTMIDIFNITPFYKNGKIKLPLK